MFFNNNLIILLIFYIKIINCVHLNDDIEKEKLWNSLIRGDFIKSKRDPFKINFNLENYSEDHLELQNDFNSKDINNNDEFTKSSNKVLFRKSRQYLYDENVKLLKTENPFYSMSLSNHDKSKEKLIIRKNKYGIQILEDPSYTDTFKKLPEPGQRSLIIVFDGTGSMFNDLEQLTQGAEAIISEITQRENNPIYNYIFVPFRDPYVGPKLVTQDLDKFLYEIKNLPLIGGGDCPESAISGINLALESALPKSFIFVFTDATAQDFNLDTMTIDLIQKQQATLTFLLTGYCKAKDSDGYKVYEKLASLSNGQIYNLEKTDIKDVLESIRTSLDTNLIPLNYYHSKEPGQHSIDIPVDSNLKQFTISLAGSNPNITVHDPNEIKSDDVKEILNLKNLKIVNVQDPQPGNWNVKTESDSEHSIKLTALSDLSFTFGFSMTQPRRIQDTNINPIALVKNILGIKPSDVNLIFNLTNVELVLVNPENNLPENITVPLLAIDSDEGLIYVTNPFEPPLNMFKIYIKGFDPNSNPLTHLLSTAITPIRGDAPRIVNSNRFFELNEGENGSLICQINSMIPVTVKWMRNNKVFQGYNDPSVTNVYKFDFNHIKLEDAGIYQCSAENLNGYDVQNFNVIVRKTVQPLVVNMVQNIMSAIEGDVDYQMSCFVSPNEDIKFNWLFNKKPINKEEIEVERDNLVIKEVKYSNSGNFTCVAFNDYTSGSDTGILNVIVPPRLNSTDETIIRIEDGEEVAIECDVVAYPPAVIKWKFNNQELAPTNDYYTFYDNSLLFTAKYKDNGIYECEATNKAGSVKKNIVLIVYVTPMITGLEDEYLSITAGKDAILPCRVSGYPIPTVEWSINNTNIISSTLYDGNDLLLTNVTNSNEGTYICEAFNEYGLTRKTIYLNINHPPKIIFTFPTNLTKLLPEKVLKMKCEAEGKPIPEVYWAKNNEKISDINSGLSEIEIKNSGDDISNFYTCTAQNSEGYDRKEIHIIGLKFPEFMNNITSNIINATAGQDIEIYCPIVNAEQFKWTKNNVEVIDSNEQVLKLRNTSLNDSGKYICTGINEAGIQDFNQELNIFSLPQIIMSSQENVQENSNFIEVIVRKGENKTLNCIPRGYPTPKVQWKKDETIISNKSELHLNNINIAHAGLYICQATNIFGNDEFRYKIQVQVPPSIQIPNKNWLEIMENDNLILVCEIFGEPLPKFSWMINEQNLSNETSNTLLIKNTEIVNRGNYKCIGENELGLDTIEFVVDILAPPKLTPNSYKNFKIFDNEDLEVKCSVQGNPLPILAWSFNNKILLSTSHISSPDMNKDIYIDEFSNPFSYSNPNEIFTSNTWQDNLKKGLYGKVSYDKNEISLSLIVEDSKSKKSGIYICYAINSIGNKEHKVNVEIYSSPKFKHGTSNLEKLSLLEGLPMILSCPWYGNPMPQIKWLKDDNLINNGDLGIVISRDGNTLTIFSTNQIHSGIYHCLAENFVGKKMKQFSVDFLSPPILKQEKKLNYSNDLIKIQHKLGQQTILECQTFGNPPPKVFWLKQNYGDNLDQIETLAENSTQLVLNNIHNSGIFSCYINNTLGFVQKKFSVEILEIPKINKKLPTEINLEEFQTLTLNCSISGYPVPKIVWYKNEKEIDLDEIQAHTSSDKTILKIFNVRRNLTGTYSCIAQNELGESRWDTKVKILPAAIWSDWESWSPCSVSCGTGLKSRRRRCILYNGEISKNDNYCEGSNFESEYCEMLQCPINGDWSDWTNWTSCSDKCWKSKDNEKPTRKRYRQCNSPSPKYGGKFCLGTEVEEEYCNFQPCAVNGQWSNWESWSSCSVTCGEGVKQRQRKCNNPEPSNGGKDCEGLTKEISVCTQNLCQINGGWSQWSSWSECSQTCDAGIRKRTRECNNPEPKYGGNSCIGPNFEISNCKKMCKNSDLLKNLSNNKKKFTPLKEYQEPDDDINAESDEINEDTFKNSKNLQYHTGSNYSTIVFTNNTEVENDNSIGDPTNDLKMTITYKNYRPIEKDLKEINFFPGKYPFVVTRIIPCPIGQELNTTGSCIDINECLELSKHNCSHNCINNIGSYFCTCPEGYSLLTNSKTCTKLTSSLDHTTSDHFVVKRNFTYSSQKSHCLEGYELLNGICEDINECITLEHECGDDQSCLNIKSSYLCIPTPCPYEYTRDDQSGQCILMCNSTTCPENPKISETLSYTMLSLKNISIEEPFLKIVNYDIQRRPLPLTTFSLLSGKDDYLFKLKTEESSNGIAYLYLGNEIIREKLYNIRIKAKSFDSNNFQLTYVTKFVIFLYLL